MDQFLKDRHALVTGAGRGIGRSVAIGLAEAGASVTLVSRTAAELDEVVATIEQAGGHACAVPADLARSEEVGRVHAAALGRFGDVDVLINNAAMIGPMASFDSIDVDAWAEVMSLNVTSVVRLTKAVLPAMLEAGWGRIVNVSSGVAGRPVAMVRANAYTTSKAALEGHTLNLAAELEGSGVTLHVYRPGTVDTAMQAWIRSQPPEQVGEALHARFMGWHESGSLLTPDASAAGLLAHLASDEHGAIWSAEG